jgi:hypothetical protein
MESTKRSLQYRTEKEYIASDDFARDHCFLEDESDLQPEVFPELLNFPTTMIYRFLPIPKAELPTPEYIYIDRPTANGRKTFWLKHNFVFSWNMTWEAGHARRNMFPAKDIPKDLKWVLRTEANVRLVYQGQKHNYDAYAPLYHLLPRKTLDLFGLPCLRRSSWPMLRDEHLLENILPEDFDRRVEKALAYHLWPRLNSRGVPSKYSNDDPIRILAHNLDFWMPYVDLVAQRRAALFGRVPHEDAKQKAEYLKYKDRVPPEISIKRPLYGGALWSGQEEADEATDEMIELADSHGNLRKIIDTIRSNRIEDDFSARWSFEREDFERRLYSKRGRVKVSFVQLDETIPVHGPESEIHESLLWGDFMAFLDEKERRVVVCLRNGETKLTEIAEMLGYSNHSPVSKRLAQIRQKAQRFFNG